MYRRVRETLILADHSILGLQDVRSFLYKQGADLLQILKGRRGYEVSRRESSRK
jgi:hypothetical protein